MSMKKQRREAAQKRARKKRIVIVAVCAAVVVFAATAVSIYAMTRPDIRIFADAGGQSVALYENGNFVARIIHTATISGTFTENVTGNVSSITFTYDGTIVSTQIEDDFLLLPEEWWTVCGHNHETRLPLVR